MGSFPVTGAWGSCGAVLGRPGLNLWFGTENPEFCEPGNCVPCPCGNLDVLELLFTVRGAASTELVLTGEIHLKWEVFGI